jgi:hypothetical protein
MYLFVLGLLKMSGDGYLIRTEIYLGAEMDAFPPLYLSSNRVGHRRSWLQLD